MLPFLTNKVQYCIFDRTFTDSTGIYLRYKFLNNLELEQVEKNRKAVAKIFGQNDIAILKQVHATEVIYAQNLQELEKEIEGDAIITDQKGILITIATADCLPLLISCEEEKVIAAVHCGWRSARSGIIKNVANQMLKLGASKLHAIIGPSIQQKSYEVDAEFYQDFINEDHKNEHLFIPSSKLDHYMFDLSGYVKIKLDAENIKLHLSVNDDTYTMPEKYPSRRRSFHENSTYRDHILSGICIMD